MTVTEPRIRPNPERMIGFSLQMERSQREFLEKFRRQQGLYSMADAARELLRMGQLSVQVDEA